MQHFVATMRHFLIISLGIAPFFNQIAMMIVQIVMNNTLTYYGAQSSYGSDIPLACAGIISKVGMIFFCHCDWNLSGNSADYQL